MSMISAPSSFCSLVHSSYAEAILLKLDSVGNIEWQNCYGGSDHDGVFSLVEVNEDYLVSAYADSDDGDVTGHHGESDIWVIMIDHSGNIIWENCFGGYRIELAYNIFKETNGDIIAIGPTSSNDGDVSGNHSLSTFDNDVWVIRINSYGDLLWQNCYGGIGNEGNVRFNALQIGTNNYIIGTITNYGPSYDVACTPYGGNQDEDYLVFEIGSLDTTGVEENEYAKDMVKVYPNPAKDYIIFETGRCPSATLKGGEPVRVIVMDVFGQELAKIKVASEKTVFDLRQLRNGIYLFQVDVEGLIYSGKIMIQR